MNFIKSYLKKRRFERAAIQITAALLQNETLFEAYHGGPQAKAYVAKEAILQTRELLKQIDNE